MENKLKVTYEIKQQHVVDCTYAKYAFDKLEDADAFAATAVEKDFHDAKDETPIDRRENYVLWKDDEFVEELEGAKTPEEAKEQAKQYLELYRIELF